MCMEFQINNAVLNEALKVLNKVIPLRSTLPVLSTVLFTSDGGKLSVRSTNLEVSIEFLLDAKISDPINTAIPISKIFSITSSLKNEELTFNIEDNYKVNIKTEFGEYNIMGISPEDFPAKINVSQSENISFSSEEIKNLIDYTSTSASTDDLKPALQGVLLDMNEAKTVFVATDGHRLSKMELDKNNTTSKKIILPIKFLQLIQGFLNETKNVELIIGENHAQIYFEGTNISTRLIKDAYPDYEKVIPKDNDKELKVQTKDLIESLKRVSVFSNKKTKQATLSIQNNLIEIKTEDVETATSAKEKVSCQYSNEDIVVAFNSEYLKEILEKTSTEETTILLKNPLSAALILPGEAPKNKISLLMPIRLN